MNEDLSEEQDLEELLKELPPQKKAVVVSLIEIDPLTRLGNVRKFNRAQFSLASRVRRGEDLVVIALSADIDHFKDINDKYGHDSGNRVLKTLGECLRNEIRDYENFYRIGGEEFLGLFYGVDLKEGFWMAERLRKSISGQCKFYKAEDSELYPIKDNKYHDKRGIEHQVIEPSNIVGITMSFGIAGYSSSDDNLDNFIAQSDKALYDAKHSGRNKVKVWTERLI